MTGKRVRLLVTGGAGFIGSNFVRFALEHEDVEHVRVLDKLAYSGTLRNLDGTSADQRFEFVHGDICDQDTVAQALDGCDAIVNFAAETHVDRSLLAPAEFIQANVHGTWVLLEAVRQRSDVRLLQVSTDEVYGSVLTGKSVETDRIHPRNPYSASKAGAEMMVIAYVETHGVDAVITRGSNTYGPYQYPEKFIPLMITNVLENRTIPVYGDGMQVRHWIHVDDHCSGIDAALNHGTRGEIYNIGSNDEWTNLDVARAVVDRLDAPDDLITHVEDRPGHDRRYALSSEKLRSLGWTQTWSFEEGLKSTIAWYQENREWWKSIRGGDFEEYYSANYDQRLSHAAADETKDQPT